MAGGDSSDSLTSRGRAAYWSYSYRSLSKVGPEWGQIYVRKPWACVWGLRRVGSPRTEEMVSGNKEAWSRVWPRGGAQMGTPGVTLSLCCAAEEADGSQKSPGPRTWYTVRRRPHAPRQGQKDARPPPLGPSVSVPHFPVHSRDTAGDRVCDTS